MTFVKAQFSSYGFLWKKLSSCCSPVLEGLEHLEVGARPKPSPPVLCWAPRSPCGSRDCGSSYLPTILWIQDVGSMLTPAWVTDVATWLLFEAPSPLPVLPVACVALRVNLGGLNRLRCAVERCGSSEVWRRQDGMIVLNAAWHVQRLMDWSGWELGERAGRRDWHGLLVVAKCCKQTSAYFLASCPGHIKWESSHCVLKGCLFRLVLTSLEVLAPGCSTQIWHTCVDFLPVTDVISLKGSYYLWMCIPVNLIEWEPQVSSA